MTERGPDILPTTSLGHYKVRAKIGSGGMGDVYDAVHTGLDKRVALKTLRKRFLDDEVVVARFLREGQLASRIRHPNIVDVTDVGMIGGLPCLVMEHLEGESLSALIRRERTVKVDRLVDLLLPIVAAVDFAHAHGVLHRDLKPSNIFLSRSWNGETVPKVLDFGISKLVHDSQQAALTTDSAFVGTPHYASPELMKADKTADGRSDQYSIGVILYEASTGIRPYAHLGNNFVALAMAICNGECRAPRVHNPDVPPAFERVIVRAMAVEANDRFPSMRALGEALLPFASERARLIWTPTFAGAGAATGVGAPPPAPMPSVPRPHAASSGAFSATPPPSSPSLTGPHLPSGPYPSPGPVLTPSAGSMGGSLPPFPRPYGDPAGQHPSATPAGAAFERLPSYGAGTSAYSPTRSRGSGLLTAAIGAVVGVAIVASVVVLRKNPQLYPFQRDEPSASASAAPPQPDATTFEVEVAVLPKTATIEVDGVATGVGRVSQTFARDGKKHVLRVSSPGHETVRIEFDEDRPPPPNVTLRALPPPVPTVVSAPRKVAPQRSAPPAGGANKPKASASEGQPKTSESRPKTDNIDPWE